MKILSCGTIVTDGTFILLGRITFTNKWDIPKGICKEFEKPIEAAIRELKEETGIIVVKNNLNDLGMFKYLKSKDLHLFEYKVVNMPSLNTLICTSKFEKNSHMYPEFDKFKYVSIEGSEQLISPSLYKILYDIYKGELNDLS